ncbi:hypothetical protein O6H91_08G093400 [Diphasiastrum complanatum]|uniref:Uncharacterized protein n=2 Tax=Diphasiastrum complanatum TaxID=34168 RepID=A0ACC2BQ75_DIPCM|nr:hypothetical protein O6H91_14G061800 [Diphasiastrum complanatum]KAJ7547588.1 hypothetical protein O6H91_08G093400 [Diphasiastrum complanatum]
MQGSFSSLATYGRSLLNTPERLRERVLAVCPIEELSTETKAKSGAEMRRKLLWYDVLALGVGGMVGAGIFVSTGSAARLYSGPSVILAYIVAGISSLLSAICYTEFGVQMPAAGGAFSYLRTTFGEFAAYLTGVNLMMEYVLSNAAVARSFTSYFATVFGGDQTDHTWLVKAPGLSPGYNMLDFPAVGVLMILTFCICCSTKDSSILNIVVTLFHLVLVIFIIIGGFLKGNAENFTSPGKPSNPGGFFPFGVRGVFNGAAIVYFSYIGYDAVATLAEEIKEPAKNLPLGVSGSVIIVSVLYCLMAASICMLLPYDLIDAGAPFSTAFKQISGWKWASNLVGLGASMGIITSLLVAMLGQARYLCVIGRAHVIPCWFARIHPRTGTPIHATVFLGLCTAFVAFFTELDVLLNLISIGTLFVFYMVANALIFHRYVVVGATDPRPTIIFLILLSVSSASFVLVWQIGYDMWWVLALCGAIPICITTIFWLIVPMAYHPNEWGAPCMPGLAAASIFLNVLLLGSVDKKSYERFGIWSGVAISFYMVYSVHATHDAQLAIHEERGRVKADQEIQSEALKPPKSCVKQPSGPCDGNADICSALVIQ